MAENSKTRVRVKIAKEDMGAFVGFKTVWGWPTRSKYLAVTHQVIRDSRWKHYKRKFAITHLPTGYVALKNFTSVRQAQLAAAIVGVMPLKLATVTKENSLRRREKLDPKLIAWLQSWNGKRLSAGAAAGGESRA
jgi:hypothetical protein